MNTLPIEFRQPIFNPDGTFAEWHIWGMNLIKENDKVHQEWLTGFLTREYKTDPAKSQQYIGLQDRNGKKIYVGDIVENTHSSRGVLVWFGDCLGIASGEINNYHAIDRVNSKQLSIYTVVGNIYQTPEMVQGVIFSKGMVFYSKLFVDRLTGKPHRITVLEVKPKTNELVVSWSIDNTENWELNFCEEGIFNGDYYFEKPLTPTFLTTKKSEVLSDGSSS